jgi:hypothetical protein
VREAILVIVEGKRFDLVERIRHQAERLLSRHPFPCRLEDNTA